MKSVNPGDNLRLSLVRGSKVVSTRLHVVGDPEGSVGDTVVAIGETLSMPVTLYRSGNGFLVSFIL